VLSKLLFAIIHTLKFNSTYDTEMTSLTSSFSAGQNHMFRYFLLQSSVVSRLVSRHTHFKNWVHGVHAKYLWC